MRRNKRGLADLKHLRRQAAATPAPAQPAGPKPAAANKKNAPAKSQTLSEADRALFRNAMRYVEKLQDPGRVLLAPVPAAPPSQLKERRLRAAGLTEAMSRAFPSPRKEGAPEAAATAAPTARRALSDTFAPAASDHDDGRYLKAGHGTDILRDLKRGKWPIGASLDLHGSTVDDARERFERFLASCLAHDIKCVRIVHGKGYGSRNGNAVLKSTVRRWLTQIGEVIAYTECNEADGGSGAVQVLLG